LTRAVALSNPAVIDELNNHFIPVEFNLSTQDFPSELGGLSLWQEAYERDSRYSLGFATSIVLGPEGTTPFGTSGCGHRGELGTSINYDPARFLEYLQASRERYLRTKQALEKRDQVTVAEVQSEVMDQLREASRCYCKVKKEIFPSDAR
jgi:hypothetical protein